MALFAAAPTYAGGSSTAPMRVSATVIARAVLTVESQPATLTVTAADLARGYVDLSAPIVLSVRTNSRAGYLLQADNAAVDLGTVELSFGDASMTLSGGESWMSRPYVAGGDTISIRARVRLGANAAAGSYALPVAFTARPL